MSNTGIVKQLMRVADKIGALALFISGDQKDYVCHVRLASTTVSIPTATFTKVPFENRNFDPENCFDLVNNRFVCVSTGFYQVSATVHYSTSATGSYCICSIFKNTSEMFRGSNAGMSASVSPVSVVSGLVYLEKGDYLEIKTYQNSGASQTLLAFSSSIYHTNLSIAKINKYSGGSSQPNGESWQTVTAFLNSWVNYGGGFPPARFFKDPFGVVHLSGLVKSGTIPASIFTLPEGYRPAYQEHFAVPSNAVYGQCEIKVDGSVFAQSGNNTWYSLNGITFRANGY